MAKVKMIALSKFKTNACNPRIIKDQGFKKLVASIKGFPEMMDKRGLVCVTDPTDGKYYPLGGNQRLRAIQEIGYKEIPETWLQLADDWTEEQRREFIIRDNVSSGEWEWEALANQFEAVELSEFGLYVPQLGHDVNNMTEAELDMTEEFDPIGTAKGLQRVVFIFDSPELAEKYLNEAGINFTKKAMAWQVNLSTQSI